ncbi:hypothetical protein GCM10023349_15180 [Nocardioides conyzicola]|uniref:cytochrome-c oxidase n=2 Tax=Nocardioides conyzicola TaxID=1651781 RepID=A0ABP8X6X5_9ACTN
MALMLLGYSALTHARSPQQLDDLLDAEIEEGAGELGFFPANSWAPLSLAAAIGVLTVGVAVGWWLTAIGIGLVTIAAIHWVFEYYVGEYAH